MNEISSEPPELCLLAQSNETELKQLAQAVCSSFPAKLRVVRSFDELHALVSEKAGEPSDSQTTVSPSPSLVLHVDLENPIGAGLEAWLNGPLRHWQTILVRETNVLVSDRVSPCCDWGIVERPIRSEWLINRFNDMLASTMEQGRIHRMHSIVHSAIGRLTDRQRTVLGSIVEGLPTKTIAKQLGFSNRLVEMERSVLLRQFSVTSTPELTLKYGQYDAYETFLRIRQRQVDAWSPSEHAVLSAC